MSRGFGATVGQGTGDNLITKYTAVPVIRSFAIWFLNTNSTTVGSFRLWQQTNAGSTIQEAFGYAAGLGTTPIIGFGWTSSTSGRALWTLNSDPSQNVWHHLCVTYDGSSTLNVPNVYIDGVLQTITLNTAPVGSLQTTPNNIYIASAASSSTAAWGGLAAHGAKWANIILSQTEISLLASGVNPLLVRPDSLAFYLPLDGINNPELDLINGNSSSITGTRLGTSDPPVQTLQCIHRVFDYETNLPGGATFNPYWAQGSTQVIQGYAN